MKTGKQTANEGNKKKKLSKLKIKDGREEWREERLREK